MSVIGGDLAVRGSDRPRNFAFRFGSTIAIIENNFYLFNLFFIVPVPLLFIPMISHAAGSLIIKVVNLEH